MEKYRRAGQATDDTIIRRMRVLCCTIKATHTHREYVILTAFSRQQWFANASHCYVYTYTTLRVLLNLKADGMYSNHRALMN